MENCTKCMTKIMWSVTRRDDCRGSMVWIFLEMEISNHHSLTHSYETSSQLTQSIFSFILFVCYKIYKWQILVYRLYIWPYVIVISVCLNIGPYNKFNGRYIITTTTTKQRMLYRRIFIHTFDTQNQHTFYYFVFQGKSQALNNSFRLNKLSRYIFDKGEKKNKIR